MEPLTNLTAEHRKLSEKKFRELCDELPVPSSTLLQEIKRHNYGCGELLQLGAKFMKENLSNAVQIWESLSLCGERPDQKWFIESQLCTAQIALGHWRQALDNAQSFYDELQSFEKINQHKNTFEENQATFQAMINLANMQRISRSSTTVEKLYQEALDFATEMGDTNGALLSKIYLAICLLDKGQLKQAIELYFEPMYAQKEIMATPTKILYLQHYGSACRSAANWGQAKTFLGEALITAKELGDFGSLSACLGELGNVYRSEGRFKAAEKRHLLHYRIALRRGDLRGLAVACGNLGFLKYYNPNELTDSVIYQAVTYKICEKIGDRFRQGVACNNIGKVYTKLGLHHQSVSLFKYSIKLGQDISNKASEGMAWGNLGTAYRFLGMNQEAIECHMKYRNNANERLDIGGVAIMQTELSLDYLLKGDLRSAEESIMGAFETLETIRDQLAEEEETKISNFEKNQSEALNLLQIILVARKKYKEAFVVSDIMRARVLSETVERRYDPSQPLQRKFRDVSSILCRDFIDKTFHQMLSVSRECKSAIVSYSLVKEFINGPDPKQFLYIGTLFPNGRLNFERRSLNMELTTKINIDESFVISLCRSLSSPRSPESILKLASRKTGKFNSMMSIDVDKAPNIEMLLSSIDEELQLTNKVDRSTNVIGESSLSNKSKTADAVKLRESTIKSSCQSREDVSSRFDGSQDIREYLPPPTNQTNSLRTIDSKTTKDETEFKNEGNFQDGSDNSRPLPEAWKPFLFQMHEVLIDPISQYLEAEIENIKNIIFVPQGFLLKVPFAALKANDEDEFLVEKFPILTAPSVNVLNLTTQRWRDQEVKENSEEFNLFSVGNPKMPSDEIEQLPSAGIEAHRIAEILGSSEVKILTNDGATKEAVKVSMGHYNVIHLASHAMVDEEDTHGDYSMRGFILLAKSNEDCDGILTAKEISEMKINAQLVVLSCCNTALGKVTEDGVLGLSRAFLTAGAACVVVTLWKIKDSFTLKIMEAFYESYKATRDAPLSLQQAMKNVQHNKAVPQPQDWAAFTIVGCSGKIRKYL